MAEGLPSSLLWSKILRRDCLLRDGHQCVIDGSLDNDLWFERGRPPNEDHADLDVAHIIPDAYASYEDADVRISFSFYLGHDCELKFRHNYSHRPFPPHKCGRYCTVVSPKLERWE